ncbi:hypothetical protein ACHQM5_013403 [Ranunculus cassubicifolius]
MVPESIQFEDRVLQTLKLCGERKDSPLTWGMELCKCLREADLSTPSPELALILVSNLSSDYNNPCLWKFLEQAITSGLLSSFQILALLTSRVIPHRRTQPEAYRLYLELVTRYAFSSTRLDDICKKKITKSVDDALQLSRTYDVHIDEFGQAFVLFFFSIIIGLIDSTLEDWGLHHSFTDNLSRMFGNGDHQVMDVDLLGDYNGIRHEARERLHRTNSIRAMEVLGELSERRNTSVLLRLILLNMPEKFNGLLQRLQFVEANRLTSSNITSASQVFARFSANIQQICLLENHLNKHHLISLLIDMGSCSWTSCSNFGTAQASCWVPYDIYMEAAMDGKTLPATSAIDILAELTKTLQVINRASWQQTFQALWIAALRLVQRERDPQEGPIPHLDARLCTLLSITPLAIARVVDEKEIPSFSVGEGSGIGNLGPTNGHGMNGDSEGTRKHGLISSLQSLGQFSGLLCPPASVIIAANNAAAKAASFISSLKNGNEGFGARGRTAAHGRSVGSMLHLIVEACIARKLIDTSAYLWPGYVSPIVTASSDASSDQGSPWSTFIEGSHLVGPLKGSLIATPASSVAEIEKIYHIALNGSDEERAAAADILCGATLNRGWNIQEHVVHLVVKLLSAPMPTNFTAPGSRGYMSMLNATLFGMSSIDVVHIVSLHGVVPEVAASLIPICEAFGSLVPTSTHKSDETSAYTIFSCAFLFLLRLWKFYRPPHEHCISEGGGYTGSELTLEYLLLLYNNRVEPSSSHPVYIDSFPKLRSWYFQNKACVASTISGLCNGNPVHQVANKILNMICRKMTKSGGMSNSGGSVSGSPVSAGEDSPERPLLPAWDILEAVPFVLEAVLTACAHGRLSSRDLTTGLRDLVDFLPASLATVISYFTAETTRGIWKPVAMNGTDWPSPAANLLSVENEIKDILSSAGVTVTSPPIGVAPVMLPLPVAALVSLTITFKLDKSMEYIQGVAGPALENCASSCPWPSMPVIGALWAQKVRRWHGFIVMTSCRSAFKQDREAVSQLLRSCFTSFLGSPHGVNSTLTPTMGINGFLGTTIPSLGLHPFVAPGFLFIRTSRTIQSVQFVNNIIVELVAESARDSAARWGQQGNNSTRLKSNQTSLASATALAKEVAMLGASLLCVAGGVQLVQLLYQETIPTWLLSTRNIKKAGPMSCILQGYAMAYLVILSGSFIWGVGEISYSRAFFKRAKVLQVHMEFMAGALDGNITLGCDPATWKAYVSCFVGLAVSFTPAWIREIKQETLRKLANGLRGWHECELALSLLERGGIGSMGYVAESVM